MKHIALLNSLLLVLASSLAAQEAPADTGRRAWVVAAQMPKDVSNPLLIQSDKALHELQMDMRLVHQSVPVDDTGVVRAVKPQVGSDGKIKHAPLAVAQLGEGVREALIVLVPNSNKGGLAFHAEVIDLAKFEKGGCLYVNLVKAKIGVTMGEHKTVVKPGGMEFINALGGEKKKVSPISFFYEIPRESDSEWKLMTASKMALYPSRREITVFFFNPEIDNVDFRGIAFPAPMPKLAQRDR